MPKRIAEARASTIDKLIAGEEVANNEIDNLNLKSEKFADIFYKATGVRIDAAKDIYTQARIAQYSVPPIDAAEFVDAVNEGATEVEAQRAEAAAQQAAEVAETEAPMSTEERLMQYVESRGGMDNLTNEDYDAINEMREQIAQEQEQRTDSATKKSRLSSKIDELGKRNLGIDRRINALVDATDGGYDFLSNEAREEIDALRAAQEQNTAEIKKAQAEKDSIDKQIAEEKAASEKKATDAKAEQLKNTSEFYQGMKVFDKDNKAITFDQFAEEYLKTHPDATAADIGSAFQEAYRSFRQELSELNKEMRSSTAEQQDSVVKRLNNALKKIGSDVTVEMAGKNEIAEVDGAHANAQWDPKTGRVLFSRDMTVQEIAQWVAAHELTHQAAKSSGGSVVSSVIDGFRALAEKGLIKNRVWGSTWIDFKNWDDTIERFRSLYGFENSEKGTADVNEELSGDLMRYAFRKSKLWKEMAQVRPTALFRLSESIDRLRVKLFGSKAAKAAMNSNDLLEAELAKIANTVESAIKLTEEQKEFRGKAEPTDEKAGVEVGDEAAVVDGVEGKHSLTSLRADFVDGQMFQDLVTAGVLNYDDLYNADGTYKKGGLAANIEETLDYMSNVLQNKFAYDMQESYTKDTRPFSVYKPNSDPLYGISLDFSTLCRKRVLTQYVIEQIQTKLGKALPADDQMVLRQMLLKYKEQEKSIQVACTMCYVEAARMKSPKFINEFIKDPTPFLIDSFAKDDPTMKQRVTDAQNKWKREHGFSEDMTKDQIKEAGGSLTEFNKIGPRVRAAYQPTSEQQQIIERAKKLKPDTYLTADNLMQLSVSEPEIYKAFTTRIRNTTRSKVQETAVPYYYGDSKSVSDKFISNVNAENGMRMSSWSDFQTEHILDLMTAVIDLSVHGSKMHAYTKFPDQVRIFGNTGIMFNMSGVPKGKTGLNVDGSLAFHEADSVDIDEAIEMREKFPATTGVQCIGVSDEHIRALLRTPWIDYVIPYHTSGLNADLRRLGGIYAWADYTAVQNASVDDSIKKPKNADKNWHKEPVFSEFFVVEEGKSGEEIMRDSAERYIQMCRDRGMTPKFSQFIDEENYWKLLIDRKMINQTDGSIIEQQPVKPNFDFDEIRRQVTKADAEYDPGLYDRAAKYVTDAIETGEFANLKAQMKKDGKLQKKSTATKKTMLAEGQQKVTQFDTSRGIKYSLSSAKIPTYEDLETKAPINVVDVSKAETKGTYKERRAEILTNAEETIKTPKLNRDTNSLIFLTKNSYTHMFSNAGEIQLNAAEKLSRFVEEAVLTHKEDVDHGDTSAEKIYTMFAAADNGLYIQPVKLKVKEYRIGKNQIPKNIAEYLSEHSDDSGSYDGLYDTVVLEVTEIEEDPRGSDTTPTSDASRGRIPSGSSTVNVTDLLSLVKGDAEKYVPQKSTVSAISGIMLVTSAKRSLLEICLVIEVLATLALERIS